MGEAQTMRVKCEGCGFILTQQEERLFEFPMTGHYRIAVGTGKKTE